MWLNLLILLSETTDGVGSNNYFFANVDCFREALPATKFTLEAFGLYVPCRPSFPPFLRELPRIFSLVSLMYASGLTFLLQSRSKQNADGFEDFPLTMERSIPLLSVIREKGESLNRGNKKTKHAKFSEKRTFLIPCYAHVRVRISG